MSFDYPLPEPPFPVREFQEMTAGEARRHFDWFVAQAPARLELLKRAIAATNGPVDQLDYSRASLVPLWTWVVPRLGTADAGDMTVGSKCLVVDVGYYLAEVIIRCAADVHWMLWTDPRGPLNQPVLTGFQVPLVPIDLVSACAWGAIRGKKQASYLKDSYDVWAELRDHAA